MTANELIKHFNETYNTLDKEWPKTLEVDAETYANCCQFIFTHKVSADTVYHEDDFYWINIAVGMENHGLMFKNVELLLKKT